MPVAAQKVCAWCSNTPNNIAIRHETPLSSEEHSLDKREIGYKIIEIEQKESEEPAK